MFQFKQFSVDQSGCAMKINTDGVLLGALTTANDPATILDIGTGTGVIALMLAQKFQNARIDAVEIDETAAQTAGRNFANSPFAARLSIFPVDYEDYFKSNPEVKYDLIVSNPPFYINSLNSPDAGKQLAKHANADFFDTLIDHVAGHLLGTGVCWLVIPQTGMITLKNVANSYELFLQENTSIFSFKESNPHRNVIRLGFGSIPFKQNKLIIYEGINSYSSIYKNLLRPYFIAF